MVDLYRALHMPLELYRGTTRTYRIRLFKKGTGGDTILGRPTAALSKGAAEDWSLYPIAIGAMAPATGHTPATVQLRLQWHTTNPGELTLIVPSASIEAALALGTDDDQALHWTCIGRRETAGVIDDEVPLVHGPVIIHPTAIRSGLSPLA